MNSEDSICLYILGLPNYLPELIDKTIKLYEFERFSQFESLKRKLEFFWTRYLIYKVLNTELGINYTKELQYTDNGKPYIEGLDCNISISHSLDYISVAISGKTELGLDIESIYKDIAFLKLADKHYSDLENQFIAKEESSLQKDNFIRLWSLKESVYKYFGLKMSEENFKIYFDLEHLKIQQVPAQYLQSNIFVEQFKYNNYWMSLTHNIDNKKLRVIKVDTDELALKYSEITETINSIQFSADYLPLLAGSLKD